MQRVKTLTRCHRGSMQTCASVRLQIQKDFWATFGPMTHIKISSLLSLLADEHNVRVKSAKGPV